MKLLAAREEIPAFYGTARLIKMLIVKLLNAATPLHISGVTDAIGSQFHLIHDTSHQQYRWTRVCSKHVEE